MDKIIELTSKEILGTLSFTNQKPMNGKSNLIFSFQRARKSESPVVMESDEWAQEVRSDLFRVGVAGIFRRYLRKQVSLKGAVPGKRNLKRFNQGGTAESNPRP